MALSVFAAAMALGCADSTSEGEDTSSESTGDEDGDGDGDPGDGDGDPGDGDGDLGDGDGDPTAGDGDPTAGDGDGDGDPTTGDGDGDPTTGDGDGDSGMCPEGSRPGAAGNTVLQTGSGFPVKVHTPPGYDPTVKAPMMVVFGAGFEAPDSTENQTNLTPTGDSQGWITVYMQGLPPMDPGLVEEFLEFPVDVAQEWCVDENRVFTTGYSNGGSMSHYSAIAHSLIPGLEGHPTAIFPMAGGLDPNPWLEMAGCPDTPLPVMVGHGQNDQVFPYAALGPPVAQWWAACNGCSPTMGAKDEDNCQHFEGCPEAQQVSFCSGAWGHTWHPSYNGAIVSFIDTYVTPFLNREGFEWKI